MTSQPDLFTAAPAAPSDSETLRHYLSVQKTWCTRAELSSFLGWTERRIREAAEHLGTDIIRCQAGFKLTADASRDDLTLAIQASEAAISQGKRMIRYGLGLKRRLHTSIG